MSAQDHWPVEPLWISRNVLDAIHSDQVEQYGGSQGVREHGLIDSDLARPINLLAYKPECDVADLAASLAFGLAKNHGFHDGNKRTALVATLVFLVLNHHRLVVGEAESVIAMVCLATDEWSESRFAGWIREHITQHSPGPTPPKSR